MATIYYLCEICQHLLLYKGAISNKFYDFFECIVHGIILLNGPISLKKISDNCIRKKSQQSIDYFINNDKKNNFSRMHKQRLIINLKNARKLKKDKKSLFIVDDFIFKKNKGKKTDGVGYNFCHEIDAPRKSQCVVSSSAIINNFHIPFKHDFFVGKKYTTPDKFKKKTDIAIELIDKFYDWSKENKLEQTIYLFDGGYTNQKIIKHIVKIDENSKFIGRFSKGRNIETNEFSGLLKNYIKKLDIEKDFRPIKIDEKEKSVHRVNITLKYGAFNLVIILDNPKDLGSSRPLITNLKDVPDIDIVKYYALRWKEETYHQTIKDGFNSRTHKFRKLKTLSRFLELINVAYGLLEHRKWSKYKNKKTNFEVKNELINISKKRFILNMKGNQMKKTRQEAILKKFRR